MARKVVLRSPFSLTTRRTQLRMFDHDWFCDDCPSDLSDKIEQIDMGEHHSLDKIKLKIKSTYQELSGWSKTFVFSSIGQD